MRVIEIFGGEPINKGGQQSFVLYTLQNMDLTETEVDLFTPYYADNTELIHFIEAHHGKVYTGDLPYTLGQSRKNIISSLREHLNSHSYDVAHIHSGSITALAYSAREAAKAGIRNVIVHSHSSGVNENIKHRLVKAYAAPIFRKYVTDYCACSTEAAQWKFPRNVMQQVHIINNGIDTDYFAFDPQIRERIRNRYSIDNKTLVLGHVGRFAYEKNQTFLIDLLQLYKETKPDHPIKLVLLGEGDDKPVIIRRVKELNLSEDVLFPTEYDMVRDYLQMFDVFLFPSLYEGLGIAAIEAQAAGLPVIASTGVPQTMRLTENVKYLSLEKKEEWISTIIEFRDVRRLDTRNEIKNAGFDIKDTAKAVQELYQK